MLVPIPISGFGPPHPRDRDRRAERSGSIAVGARPLCPVSGRPSCPPPVLTAGSSSSRSQATLVGATAGQAVLTWTRPVDSSTPDRPVLGLGGWSPTGGRVSGRPALSPAPLTPGGVVLFGGSACCTQFAPSSRSLTEGGAGRFNRCGRPTGPAASLALLSCRRLAADRARPSTSPFGESHMESTPVGLVECCAVYASGAPSSRSLTEGGAACVCMRVSVRVCVCCVV